MPEVEILIGGRAFAVSCQAGEEQFLHTAAALLDTEAQVLVGQLGRVPESRMLLMAGLMLADKTAGLEDRLREAEAQINEARDVVARLEARPAVAPEKIEVPVLPEGLGDSLAELAARAEALAADVEERAGPSSEE